MDVGADNFRFTLEEKNGLAEVCETTREPKTTELHVDSLDRYLPSQFRTIATANYAFNSFGSQVIAKAMGPIVLSSTQSGVNTVIQTSRPLSYGYYSRLAITQMNLHFRMPTFVTNYNDILTFVYTTAGVGTAGTIQFPQGYYTYDDAAAYMQTQFRLLPGLGAMTVTPPNVLDAGPLASVVTGFTFTTNSATTLYFFFLSPVAPGNQTNQEAIGRCGRTLGLDRAAYGFSPEYFVGPQQSTSPVPWVNVTSGPPNWLPTDYIDIVSQSLTNYKEAKDTNSSLSAPNAVIGRVWLSECPLVYPGPGSGIPVSPAVLGFGPLSFCKSWDNPNWCQWSPNQSIDKIDIKLLDMWGNQLFWSPFYNTEWQMTITLTE